MDCLDAHQHALDVHCEMVIEKSNLAPSSWSSADEVAKFVEETKVHLKNVDMDIRDAKRRVAAAKPKKPKKIENYDSDSEEGSE